VITPRAKSAEAESEIMATFCGWRMAMPPKEPSLDGRGCLGFFFPAA
jgi:hypothetical protein